MIAKKIVLSIIVPAYNVELYIERCLLSLLSQDVPTDKYEVIVINDGSTDNTGNIVRKMMLNHSNLRLMDQPNSGVSVARNYGMGSAKGDYILFVDSDDCVNEFSLGKFLDQAITKKLDVLYMGFEEWDFSGQLKGRNEYVGLNDMILSGTEAYRATRENQFLTPDRSVSILFRSQNLSDYGLGFTPDIPFLEDGLFVGKVLCLAGRCGFNDKSFYKYIRRKGSASTKNEHGDLKRIKGFVLAANDLRMFGDQYQFDEEHYGLVNNLIAKYVLSALMNAIATKRINIFKDTIDKFKNDGIYCLSTNGLYNLKPYAKIYNFSPWLFIVYYIFETLWKKTGTVIRKRYC